MKITKVRAYPMRSHAVWVEVEADGVSGFGECYPNRADWATRLTADVVNEGLASAVIGSDCRDIDVIWHLCYRKLTPRQGDKGPYMAAISGLDIALWDLVGKVQGMPVHQLLGGAHHDRIPLYASIGGSADRDLDEYLAEVRRFADRGFAAFKVRTHWGAHRVDVDPVRDLAVLRAVRAEIGDCALGFDVNNGYTPKTAISQCRRLADLDLFHIEEPVAQHDLVGMAQVSSAVDIPVAAGEQEYTRWQFRDLALRGEVDVLQPDVTKCGGITELRKIMHLADILGRRLVPHQNQATLGLAASMAVMACWPLPLPPQEFLGEQPQLEELLEEPPRIENGSWVLNAEPGLGLRIKRASLEAASL
ncbi:mandelate racemase/muconate lactonizing enzyme family protein [Nocardia brasiliensis]|uniref:mandelate racemase/muconate lactonizing enzyme family protein n=1 Tax=Nocardia brasiliensis TaxID=37326 RepID=UPI00189368B6|nr:mandelate racemase/muconate lactonizing enzyme family protein [Nocardia brasiliensis]MBF6126605.1 mandelate racemase/muconate lactonizing enzyme family protein [Nocardia brasiliensis]